MCAASAHAKIGPSALYRLLACPGSHRLTKHLPSGGSNAFSAHGTMAHSVAERCLTLDLDPALLLGEVETHDGFTFELDEEMCEGVAVYLDAVRPVLARAAEYWLEHRVDLAPLWNGAPPEPIFGTADLIAYDGKARLTICDLKFGAVPVDVEMNPQLLAYALGAYYALGAPRAVRDVEIIVVQPRAFDGSSAVKPWNISIFDLLLWAEEILKPGIEALGNPSSGLRAGGHCRYCPAVSSCPALRAEAQRVSKTEFQPVPPDARALSDAELAEALTQSDMLKVWIAGVRNEALSRAAAGKVVPGYELVAVKRHWRYADTTEAKRLLAPHAEVWTRKLLHPSRVARLLPDKHRELVEKGVIDRPAPGIELRPGQGTREAVAQASARADFPPLELMGAAP